MEPRSIFDDDIKTQLDIADIVHSLRRIENSINTLNLTVAFGIGVLMVYGYYWAKS